MIVIDCEQGSEEWHSIRSGVITASMFEECRKVVGGLTEQQKIYVRYLQAGMGEDDAMRESGYKSKPKGAWIKKAISGEQIGDYSDKAKQYAFRLAVERISGAPLAEEQFETYAMRRGRELEAEARLAHEEAKGILVDQTGIALTDDRFFGASVDGLIDDDGCSEYKCFISPSSLKPILIDNDYSAIEAQVQGQLWITGRVWSDFVLYCPALRSIGKHLTIKAFQRDEEFIEELEQDMLKFNDLVEEYKRKLEA